MHLIYLTLSNKAVTKTLPVLLEFLLHYCQNVLRNIKSVVQTYTFTQLQEMRF